MLVVAILGLIFNIIQMKILDHHHDQGHGNDHCEPRIVNPNYKPSSASPPESDGEAQYKNGEKDEKNELLLPKTQSQS